MNLSPAKRGEYKRMLEQQHTSLESKPFQPQLPGMEDPVPSRPGQRVLPTGALPPSAGLKGEGPAAERRRYLRDIRFLEFGS